MERHWRMVFKDNDGGVEDAKGKLRRFSSNEFRKNIGCLVSDPTFGLGGSRLWEKKDYTKISRNNRKISSI